jgi:hypothetical protein
VPILITEKHYLFAMMREKPEELAVIVEYKWRQRARRFCERVQEYVLSRHLVWRGGSLWQASVLGTVPATIHKYAA